VEYDQTRNWRGKRVAEEHSGWGEGRRKRAAQQNYKKQSVSCKKRGAGRKKEGEARCPKSVPITPKLMAGVRKKEG